LFSGLAGFLFLRLNQRAKGILSKTWEDWIVITCVNCGSVLSVSDVGKHNVCPICGYHVAKKGEVPPPNNGG